MVSSSSHPFVTVRQNALLTSPRWVGGFGIPRDFLADCKLKPPCF